MSCTRPSTSPGHNIPNSALKWVTRVTKVAKSADMAKTTQNCLSARPTPLHTNPLDLGPENSFSAQKNQKIHDF